jgi:predicted secreted protein
MYNAFVLFITIWVIIFFMILPLKVSIPRKPRRGWASSAPRHSYIRRKILWTTVVSSILWGVVYGLERHYHEEIDHWLKDFSIKNSF